MDYRKNADKPGAGRNSKARDNVKGRASFQDKQQRDNVKGKGAFQNNQQKAGRYGDKDNQAAKAVKTFKAVKAVKSAPADRPELPEDMIAGRNAVMEALKGSRSVNRIMIANGAVNGSIKEIVAVAKEKGVNINYVERSKLESIAAGIRHQGVLAQVAPVSYVEVEDILAIARAKNETPFILLLDELEDPHNVGALLRTADAVGVHGVLIPKRRSCPLSAAVAKTSAGAVEHVPVARIGNVVQAIKSLKEEGLWVAAADMDGADYYDANMTGPLLLIVGSEGHGVGRLVKEQCDFVVKLPMSGKINSLNASVAGSVLMYEAMRQRLQKK